MASVIPQYDQRTSVGGATTNLATPTPVSIGPGLQALATGAQSVADAQRLVNQRRVAVEVSNNLASLRERTARRFEEAQGAAALDAKDFTDQLLRDFDADAHETAKASTAGAARELVRAQARDIRVDLAQRAIRFEADTRSAHRIDQFSQGVNTAAAAVERMPDTWRAVGAEQLLALDAMQLDPTRRLQLGRSMDSTIREAAARGIAKLAPESVLAKIDAGSDELLDGLSPESRARIKNEARNGMVQNGASTVLSAYETGGASAGLARQAEVLKAIPQDLRDEARTAINSQLNALRAQQREQYAQDLATVETAISTDTAGEATRRQVQLLWNVGALTPADFASYEARIAAVNDKRDADSKALAAVSSILSAGMPVDPGNEQQMRGLDAAFRRESEGAVVGDPRFQAAAATYAGLARVLPASADSWLSSAARSPSAQVAGSAAQFFGLLQDRASEAAAKVDADTKSMLGLMASMVKAGTSPQAAFEAARANVFDTRRDVVDLRRQALGAKDAREGTAAALKKNVNKDFDGWLSRQPAVPDALAADFEGGVAAYYQKTGNLQVARQLAWADVRRVWGRSEVNGKPELLAYAPEAMHPGMTPEIIRSDLRKVLRPLEVDADKVRLVQSPETAHSAGMRWSLVTKDKYGADEVVLGKDGAPLRYVLPMQDVIDKAWTEMAESNAAKVLSDATSIEAAKGSRAKSEATARRMVEQARKGVLPRRGGLD